MMATLTDLRHEVGTELGLDYLVAGDDQTNIDRALNRAVRKVLRDTRCYVTTTTVTPGASENYTLGATILDVDEMYATSSSQDYPLVRVSPYELRRMRRAASSGTTGPARYYAFRGSNLVLFYPIPGATDTVTIYYVPVPTALSSGANDTSAATFGGIPDDYAHMITLWAMHRLASYDDDQSSAQGQRYLTWYRDELAAARRELVKRGGHRLGRAVLSTRRQFIAHPSQDVY
jgi:hypothetical protein